MKIDVTFALRAFRAEYLYGNDARRCSVKVMTYCRSNLLSRLACEPDLIAA